MKNKMPIISKRTLFMYLSWVLVKWGVTFALAKVLF